MAIAERSLSAAVRAKLQGGMTGKVFYVDVAYGDDNAHGRDPLHCLRTLDAAHDKVTSYEGDVIVVMNKSGSAVTMEAAGSDTAHMVVTKSGFSIVGADFFFGRPFPSMALLDQDDDTTLIDITTGNDIFISHLNVVLDDSATPVACIAIADDCDGIAINRCFFKGDNTKAAIAVDAEDADYLHVVDCVFRDVKTGIDTTGVWGLFLRNSLVANQSGAVGIKLGADSDYCTVQENYLYIRGTGSDNINITAGAEDNMLVDNIHNENSTDYIDDSGTRTVIIREHETGHTTFDGTSATATLGWIDD